MGTIRSIFFEKEQKKHPILIGCHHMLCLRSKAIHNKAFAYHHSGQLCLGGISGF